MKLNERNEHKCKDCETLENRLMHVTRSIFTLEVKMYQGSVCVCVCGGGGGGGEFLLALVYKEASN